jgi:hydrogenase-4 membrane subunit HyfE
MSPLLVALLGVYLIPLFVATWRTSLFGLASQGLLMAAIAHRLEPALDTPAAWLTLFDLALVRGVAAPLALYTVLLARNAPARNDLIPPNLLSWTFALGMVLASFSFAERLVGEGGDQQTLVAVASTGVMLGFLVLSTRSGPFSQMVGALRIENAIALLELGGERHEQPLAIQVGMLGVFIATIAFFRFYLRTLDPRALAANEGATAPEGPTL